MTRKRMEALRYSTADIEAVTELVFLHLRFHTYKMGWSDSAVRRYVRDAGDLLERAQRADALRLHDARRAQGGPAVAADGRAARRASTSWRPRRSWPRSDPSSTAREVMAHLGVPPGPLVGQALAHLLEIRLDEGEIGHDAATQRLPTGTPRRSGGMARGDRVVHRRVLDGLCGDTNRTGPGVTGTVADVRDDLTDRTVERRRASTWRWVRVRRVRRRPARRAGGGRRDCASARRRPLGRPPALIVLGRRRCARAAAPWSSAWLESRRIDRPPQPHDRPPRRHRARAAPAPRRPARGGAVARRRSASCAAPTPRRPS